ncbi:hypothetical protein HB662_14000 [Roseomonas frigidaquae]|uniref:Uncharacterized protein n=1 Tax=Falsiroseomonas frigidaquae TaxID=487318 RepID=A0ABX1F0P4_9PROT|nr:hypothetical protein [Falsiroseomonas frigidaquae]NKE45900.1 hypothetical protein [Falsiroseomonas frigidaquae]
MSVKIGEADGALSNADLARLLSGEVGFSGEIRCHQRLLSAGYDVHPSPFYTDDETKKQREIDFATFTQCHFRRGRHLVEAEFYLVADVKTSTAPAIVFLSQKTIWDTAGATTPFFAQRNLGGDAEHYSYHNTFLGGSVFGDLIGRSVVKHLSRSERDTKNQFSANFFREAMYSAVKAAIAEWQEQRSIEHWPQKGNAVAKFFVPLIVIDGPLKSCIARENKIEVQDIPYCTMRFDAEIETHKTYNKGRHSSFLVAVCQIDHIIEFMNIFDALLDARSFRNWISTILSGKGDWQPFARRKE